MASDDDFTMDYQGQKEKKMLPKVLPKNVAQNVAWNLA